MLRIKKWKLFICCYLIATITSTSYACTSFAVYTDQANYYGKNYDHMVNKDLKFTIEENPGNGVQVFSLKVFIFDYYYPTVSMSERGLFMSINDLYPQRPLQEKTKEQQVDICDYAFGRPYVMDTVDEIREDLKSKEIICQYISEHALFADNEKDAMIIEPSTQNYHQMDIKENYLLMTNFPTSNLNDKDGPRYGFGYDRYEIGTNYIKEHLDQFGYQEGLELLEKTSQGATQCSMLFSPDKQEVLLFIGRNREKIWKASLKTKTISTYSGFKENKVFDLDSEGVHIEQLLAYEDEDAKQHNEKQDSQPETYKGMVILVLLMVVIMGMIIAKRKKANE